MQDINVFMRNFLGAIPDIEKAATYWSPKTQNIFIENHLMIFGGKLEKSTMKYFLFEEDEYCFVNVYYEIGTTKMMRSFAVILNEQNYLTWPLFHKANVLKKSMVKNQINYFNVYTHGIISRREELMYIFLGKQVKQLYEYVGKKEKIDIFILNENDQRYINIKKSNFVNPEDGKVFIYEKKAYINEIHHELIHSILSVLNAWPSFIVREGYAEAFHSDEYYRRVLCESDHYMIARIFKFDERKEALSSLDTYKIIVLAGVMVKYIIQKNGIAKVVQMYVSADKCNFGEMIENFLEPVSEFKKKYIKWFCEFMKGSNEYDKKECWNNNIRLDK